MRVDIVRYDSFDPTSLPATLLHDLRDLIEGIVLPEPRDQHCTEFTLDPNIHRVYGVKYPSHLGVKIKAYCTSHADALKKICSVWCDAAVQAINDVGVNCARILGGIRGTGWRLKYSIQYKHDSYLTIGRVRTGAPELDNVRGRPDEPESGAYDTAYPTSGSTLDLLFKSLIQGGRAKTSQEVAIDDYSKTLLMKDAIIGEHGAVTLDELSYPTTVSWNNIATN